MNDFSSTTRLDTPTFYHKIDQWSFSTRLINEYENKNKLRRPFALKEQTATQTRWQAISTT